MEKRAKAWLVANWRYVVSAVVLILLLGIVLQKCESGKKQKHEPVTVPSHQSTIDSLIREAQKAEWMRLADKKRADSLEDLLAKQGIELAVANQRGRDQAKRYTEAKAKPDTPQAFIECDAMAVTIQDQADRIERFQETTNVLLGAIKKADEKRDEEVAALRKALEISEQERRGLRLALDSANAKNAELVAESNKSLRKRKWGKTKERILAGAVIVLGVIAVTK